MSTVRKGVDSLQKTLEKEGLTFRQFSVEHVGEYDPADADWNYKDVPHLNEVHGLVNACLAYVRDDAIATINTQKILGLTVPLTVFNYAYTADTQVYYTTLLMFVLIVETQATSVGNSKTRVVTTYHVGSPVVLRWAFPVIRWILRRNYDALMKDDVPMRTRRGTLRRAGYTFDTDGKPRSFVDTIPLNVHHVVPPAERRSESHEIQVSDLSDGEWHALGSADHLGVRLVRRRDVIQIFPRMCMHEGASLDGATCEPTALRCPWHGRAIGPLATFVTKGEDALTRQAASSSFHDFILQGGVLRVVSNGEPGSGQTSSPSS